MRARKDFKYARRPTPPGEILLEEFMKPLNLTQTELAKLMKVPRRRVNEIVGGRREVTPDTGHRLAAVFRTSAEFWVNLQLRFDLWRVYQVKRQEYQAIKPITKESKNFA